MSKTRVFYDKEPYLHKFYVDWENKRFYKHYNLNTYKAQFEIEKYFYTLLQGSKYIPHIYDIREVNGEGILEMEYIQAPPLYGYGRMGVVDRVVCSRRQKDLIREQLKEFEDFMSTKYEGKMFQSNRQNILFDPYKERIVFFDFHDTRDISISDGLKAVHLFLDTLEGGDEVTYLEACKNITIKKLLYPDRYLDNTYNEIYEYGEKLYEDIGKGSYHTFYLNDKLVVGQRLPLAEDRLNLFQFPLGHFKNKTVLDIGCNYGEMSIYAIENGASRTVSVEKSVIATNLSRYVTYLDKTMGGHSLYSNIEVVNKDIADFVIPSSDICFYLSCRGHMGSLKLHSTLGKEIREFIYVEGHGLDGEKEAVEKILPEFGSNWKWTFLGYCKEAYNDSKENRPLYKGERI